jgi:Na+-driven multidrug efflux pump
MSSLSDRMRNLASLSIPMIGNAILSQMISLVTMLYVGRIEGAIYMGAATLGNMLCVSSPLSINLTSGRCNISGYSLAYGMCCALDVSQSSSLTDPSSLNSSSHCLSLSVSVSLLLLQTLLAQAYGARLYSLMGLHIQRAIVILTLFSIPVSLIWIRTDTILRVLLFIDEETAYLAGIWARYIVYGLWPTLMFQILRRVLQSCGIIWPTIIANIISTVSVIVGTYIMIYRWHWGFAGAAIGVVVSQWIGFLVLASITWGLMAILRSDVSSLSLSLSLVPLSVSRNWLSTRSSRQSSPMRETPTPIH